MQRTQARRSGGKERCGSSIVKLVLYRIYSISHDGNHKNKETEPMTAALQKLIDAASTIKPTAEQREEQRRSFAFGNTSFENSRITREMVDRQAELLAKEQNAS
jgi:hypothetical protein